ncbi:hypothetical protein PIB30_063000 [Stylosanthes scabra]|uniref:Putative plant transposon protein domain-containing protein n=1 Tax=Stylosanthes scabra TaxID=79078 RepID=A0ABU6UK48_9FABA|nr:hypothetical protein [Stylosanthes scabra]
MASSSSVSVFDNYRFRTAFNEELYNTTVKNKKVILERRLAAPKTEISKMLIHEFYANAIITEEEREEQGGHPYMSFVRGVPVNFSPKNIRRVMRFKAEVEGVRTDFETRKAHDQQLDNVLADLCMPGATWKLSTDQQKVPIQLRRQELNPLARGWHEKNKERKLAEQETKFGSNSREEFHAYAWKRTHMRTSLEPSMPRHP